MRRRHLAPLLILLLATVSTAWWLGSRSGDGTGEGTEIDRDSGGPEAAHPVLRGAPDARGPARESTSKASDPLVVVRRGGAVSGVAARPPRGHAAPAPNKELFRITGSALDPDTSDVRLRVVDERGNPRGGVGVRLSPKGEDGRYSTTHEAVVDASGATTLEGARPGPAYLWLNVKRARRHVRIRLEAGRITEVDVEFPVGVTVEGRVRHVEKGLLADIRVNVEVGKNGSGGRYTDTSDAEGRYRLVGVPWGTHHVSLTGRAIGFHPRAKAQVVVEENARRVDHDIVLGVVGIRGAVRDAVSGRPVPQVRVNVGRLYADVTTDAAGLYAVTDVPPGTYYLWFARDGYAQQNLDGITVVSDEVTIVNAELDPAATILFHLHTPAGDPVPGVAQIEYATEKDAEGETGSARITADERGLARYDRIVPGRYRLVFRMEGHTAEPLPLEVRPGENPVEVVCAPKILEEPPALRGIIRDVTTREPIGGVRLSHHRTTGDPAVSDSEGAYVFRRLRPASHDFWIRKDGYGIILVRGIQVKAGETTVRDIDLQPAGTLHLHITDARGNPVVGRVVLGVHPRKGTEGTSLGTSVTADANGHAVYRHIVPGSYKISVSAGNTGRSEAEAEMGLGETTLRVRLEWSVTTPPPRAEAPVRLSPRSAT